MFYIYEKSSTYIMGYKNGKVRPDHRKSYKTMASARAALTKWSHQWWREEGINGDSANNNPHFRYGIARANYFHNTIEKKRTVYSIFDEAKENPITETVNTPGYMSPSRESYWSM